MGQARSVAGSSCDAGRINHGGEVWSEPLRRIGEGIQKRTYMVQEANVSTKNTNDTTV